MKTTFLVTAGILLVGTTVVFIRVFRSGRCLRVKFIPVKAHYVQLCIHLAIYIYWGHYWSRVYFFAPLLLAQLLFLNGSNNLFYGLGAPIADRNFSSGLSADPQFVNLAGFDFHVTANSPARGAGADTGLLTDIDGAPRPHGGPFDLGAYSFVQASQPTVALSVSPDSLSFNAAGGSTPGVQSLTIATPGGSVRFQLSASSAWISVSPTSGVTPAVGMVAVNPAGLAPGSYTAAITVSATGATNSPLNVSVTLVVPRLLPVVTAVLNAASMTSGIQSNSWATIWGTNLSLATRLWGSADVVDGKLPLSLEGVSVVVNGKAAVVSYVSPTQINALTPMDTNTGPVSVVVINNSGSSASFSPSLQTYAPGFSMFDSRYPAAIIPTSSTTFDYLGPDGRFLPAFPSRPAKPGEVVEFFGTGFGPTTPPAPSLQWFTSNAFHTDPVAITIGGIPANVAWGGMSAPGLYQFNVTIPDLPEGDHKLVASIGGVRAQDNVFVAVRR